MRGCGRSQLPGLPGLVLKDSSSTEQSERRKGGGVKLGQRRECWLEKLELEGSIARNRWTKRNSALGSKIDLIPISCPLLLMAADDT